MSSGPFENKFGINPVHKIFERKLLVRFPPKTFFRDFAFVREIAPNSQLLLGTASITQDKETKINSI